MAREGLSEREELALLYDVYGGLLSERQRDVVEQHVHLDLSLGEIAGNEGVSRQAVHDVLRRARAQLARYERELGVARRYARQRRKLGDLSRELAKLKEAWVAELVAAGETARAAGSGGGRPRAAGARRAAASAVRAGEVHAALMRAERIVYELLED